MKPGVELEPEGSSTVCYSVRFVKIALVKRRSNILTGKFLFKVSMK